MRQSGQLYAILAFFSICLIRRTVAIDPNCDYLQSMATGVTYYIYNNQYPNKYPGGTSCRWAATSPPGTKIKINCEEINIPSTTNCVQDRVSISLTGDANLADAHNYCGTGKNLLLTTLNNKLTIGLFAAQYSQGGTFICSIIADPVTTPPPPTCDCGWRQERRIVGGTETGIHEYPSMAGLIDANERLICGATIISDRVLVTAAHCLAKRDYRNLAVLVGDHDLSTGTEAGTTQLIPLQQYIVHEYYNNLTQQNDIALLVTRSPIIFSINVGPVCLPYRYVTSNFVNQKCTLMGWGTTDFSDPKSDVLLAADVNGVSNAECQNKLSAEKIYQSQICTYAPGKDACQFDSGGPLMYYDLTTRRNQLIGIISYGMGCASALPAVNTRVTSYLPWIEQRTGLTFCKK